MIKRHWDGVIDAVLTNVTNARSEATNAKIQWISGWPAVTNCRTVIVNDCYGTVADPAPPRPEDDRLVACTTCLPPLVESQRQHRTTRRVYGCSSYADGTN